MMCSTIRLCTSAVRLPCLRLQQKGLWCFYDSTEAPLVHPAGTQNRVLQGRVVKACSPARVLKQAGAHRPRQSLRLAVQSQKLWQRAPWPRGRAAQQLQKIAPPCSALFPQRGGLAMR